jgi:predicted acyl esterase
MTSDLVLLGAPQLTFFFSSDQTDTDFMFTLKDIDPADNTLFLQRSLLRASLRAVDRESSTVDDIVQAFTRSENLVPGEIYEVRLSLGALGHVVREGHRLELSILSPGSVPNPVWGFAPALASSVNTLYHGDRYPSKLLLPVVRGEKARKPAPSPGALRNQPCRV